MRTRNVLIVLMSLCIMAGCSKQPETQGADMHEFTQEELQKKKLDHAFTKFFEAFHFNDLENPTPEIVRNSRISFPSITTVRYSYVQDGQTLIEIDVRSTYFVAQLYGGITLEGESPMDGKTKIFIDGIQTASLGYVWYEYKENGDTKRLITPVFRFPDGTTYAITGILLVDPLIEFLLEYVFKTE